MWIAIVAVGLSVLLTTGFLLKKKSVKRGNLLIVLCCTAALILSVGTAVCWSAPENSVSDYDYAILLGALLDEGQPSPELERRLAVALEWQKSDDETVLIVSGGKPDGQDVSEAQVMSDWLKTNGADMSRIYMEDQAADTRQNILFSKVLAEKMGLETDTVLLITSGFHQTRAGFLAERLGQEPVHLSCATPFLRHLDASFREVFAFVKAFFETL